MIALAGWRQAWRYRRDLRDLRSAYENVLIELIAERERSSHAGWLATKPCSECAALTSERDLALLERDTARGLSEWQERMGWGSARADGCDQ